MACSSRKRNIQWTRPFLYLWELCPQKLMGQMGNSHCSFIHGLHMDVIHLNKYEDVPWAGQDVSGKVCPSLFSPAHMLPLQCNTGLLLRSWRPAENHHQKTQLLPTELFFYLPAPQVAACCYSENCRCFKWCEAQWFQRKPRHKPGEVLSRSAVWVSSESCRIKAPCTVARSFHNRCLSMDLELHGLSCCWSCCSDAEHEPAPLESSLKSLFARNTTGKIFAVAALAAQRQWHREGTADIWKGRRWWQWHPGKGLQPRAEEERTSAVAAGGASMNDFRKFSILHEWAAGLDDCNDLFRP